MIHFYIQNNCFGMETTMDRIKGMAYCGLACCVCSENKECAGCRNAGCANKEWCKSFKCCTERNLQGCFECGEYPCEYEMLHKIRNRAFTMLMQSMGEEKLMNALENGERLGLKYHYEGKLTGDYDKIETVDELSDIMRGLADGRLNLMRLCPVYETDDFFLRPVVMEDAEALLSCYSDEKSWPIFNKDNCSNDFHFTELSQMQATIGFWIKDMENNNYIRLSIINKETYKAIGTIELFNWHNNKPIRNLGLLRLDLASAYEKREYINQIFSLVQKKMCPALGIEQLSTKAIPTAFERLAVMKSLRYTRNIDRNVYIYPDLYILKKI